MDKVVETISINQLPFEQVERTMGIPPSAFLNGPDADDIIEALTVLTNGRSCLTPQIDLSEYDLGYKYARFSLYERNGSYYFRVHPVRNTEKFDNIYDLDEREIELLYQGEKIIKVLNLEGKGDAECLIQLMPDTNAQIACPRYTIDIPDRIGEQNLTPEMKDALKSGEKLTVQSKEGRAFDIQIDLASHNMLKVKENNDRLLRAVGSYGQQQEALGMGSVVGQTQKSSSSKSKSKSTKTATTQTAQVEQTVKQEKSESAHLRR